MVRGIPTYAVQTMKHGINTSTEWIVLLAGFGYSCNMSQQAK